MSLKQHESEVGILETPALDVLDNQASYWIGDSISCIPDRCWFIALSPHSIAESSSLFSTRYR